MNTKEHQTAVWWCRWSALVSTSAEPFLREAPTRVFVVLSQQLHLSFPTGLVSLDRFVIDVICDTDYTFLHSPNKRGTNLIKTHLFRKETVECRLLHTCYQRKQADDIYISSCQITTLERQRDITISGIVLKWNIVWNRKRGIACTLTLVLQLTQRSHPWSILSHTKPK